MTLYLSGKNNKDIEDICIRGIARWFKTHKSFIIIRLVAYTVAVFLFREIYSGAIKPC